MLGTEPIRGEGLSFKEKTSKSSEPAYYEVGLTDIERTVYEYNSRSIVKDDITSYHQNTTSISTEVSTEG